MSKHSLNTNPVFLNAKSPIGFIGFMADCVHGLDFSVRETSQGMARVRRNAPDQAWGYPRFGQERSLRQGIQRLQAGQLLPVLWARLVLCGSSAS
ncbi:MAG: hypothetical protein ACK6D3_10925 [Planctomycetaceae bacterium]|jgi:hypothetical protein